MERLVIAAFGLALVAFGVWLAWPYASALWAWESFRRAVMATAGTVLFVVGCACVYAAIAGE